MNQRRPIRRVLAALTVMAAMTAIFYLTRSREADALFLGGAIHTLDHENRTVEAIAVADGRIIDLGSSDDLRRRYDADTTIDLGGRAVLPGFVDAHGRLMNLGIAALTLELGSAGSVREAVALVGRHAALVPPGTWIRGRGWKNAWWDEESARPSALLDEVTPRHPVFLVGDDGATAWVNTLVLAEAGISERPSEHEPGTIVRDRTGKPIGILLDEATTVVRGSMPPPTDWELNAALDSAARLCLRGGITAVHDFGATEREIALYRTRAAAGTLPLRIDAVIGGMGETWEAYRRAGPLVGEGSSLLSVKALELYVDGSLESRTAALMEAYADRPDTRGVTFADERQLASAVRTAMESGFQVCLNTRGDRAVHVALNAIAEALGAAKDAAGQVRLEGVQLASPEDLKRAQELGVIVSMQPAQYLLDFDIATARLGPERMGRFMPWPGLLASQCPVAGGTDSPIGPADPMLGISLVVERGASGVAGGPEGRQLRLAAIRMFTIWPAEAAGRGTEQGSLEEGKLADLLVLSDDPLTVEVAALSRLALEMVVVGGRIVSGPGTR